MDFAVRYTAEQTRFRKTVRDWLADQVPSEVIGSNEHFEAVEVYQARRELGRRLGVRGWLYPMSRLAPPGKHLAVATELAEQLARKPPLAVRAVVEARRGELEELELRCRLTRPRGLHLSADFQEALQAHVQRREPNFEGR